MAEELVPGETFEGVYELKEKISSTDLKQKWLINESETGRALALTLLNTEMSPEKISSTAKRLATTKGLVHPSILLTTDFGSYLNYPYLIEPEDGLNEPLKIELLNWSLIDQVLDAVAFSHSLGIAHGFLHPSNLLIDEKGNIQISGFGLPSEFNASRQQIEFLRPKTNTSSLPSQGDDYYSIGRLLAYMISGSTNPEIEQYSLGMSSQVKDTIGSLLNVGSSEKEKNLFETRLILAEHFSKKSETIEAVKFRKNETGKEAVSLTKNAHKPSRKTYILVGGLIVGAVITLTILTNVDMETQPVSEEVSIENLIQENQPRTILSPREAAEQELLVESGKKLAKEILELQVYLDDLRVSLWAEKEYQDTQKAFETAEILFLEGREEEALTKYSFAAEQLNYLKKLVPEVFEENLKKGKVAIENGDFVTAIDSLTIANAIKQDDFVLERLLTRAKNLEQVLDFAMQASIEEKKGRFQESLKFYKAASDLDPAWEPASEGIKRIQNKIRDQEYIAIMSAGMEALGTRNYPLAIRRFEEAEKIFPERQGHRDGFLRAQQEQITETTNGHIFRAEAMISSYDWKGAKEEYLAALTLSPDLVQPKNKIKTINKRLDLINSLNRLVQDPMLLKSDAELSEAIRVVAELTDQREKSDETARKIQELINYISLARTKIPVLFLSDNQSNVIIERFQSLGQFQQLEINLVPGRYTVTSSRSGFRDLRKKVLVLPGSTENQFYIANTEPVR